MVDSKKRALEAYEARPEISLIQEKLIGRVILQWSKVDAGLNELIWRFLNISADEGRIMTGRLDPVVKIATARKLAELHLQGEALEKLKKALLLADDVRDDRNFIVHGTWGTLIGDGTPIALSLRGKADPGEVRGETFPPERMRRIIRDIFRVKEALLETVELLPPLRETPPQPIQPDPSTPPTRPEDQSPQ